LKLQCDILLSTSALRSNLRRYNVDTSVMSAFKVQFAELTKLYVETKDNVKFLTTLERHFKNITHYKSIANGSLSNIADTLAPMLNALRMVWIISRHYSDDARMGSLMERIANEIGDKVKPTLVLLLHTAHSFGYSVGIVAIVCMILGEVTGTDVAIG